MSTRIKKTVVRLCLMASVATVSCNALAFADDEARRAILDLREQVKALQSAQLNFVSRIESLQNQNRILTGRIEEITNRLEMEERSGRDLYKDIDQRLSKFEPTTVEINGKSYEVQPQEKQAYENALTVLQEGNYRKAAMLFDDFAKHWKKSPYRPDALFWLGSCQFAVEHYKSAFATQNSLIRQYPKHARVPDAMLSVASSQAALGNVQAAKATLNKIIKQYPKSETAADAKARLKALK